MTIVPTHGNPRRSATPDRSVAIERVVNDAAIFEEAVNEGGFRP